MTNYPSIPTSCRGSVRAFLKGRPEWDQHCADNGIVSREAKNADLMAFADKYGYLDRVLKVIGAAPAMVEAAAVKAVAEDAGASHSAAVVLAEAAPEGSLFDLRDLLAGVDQFLSPLVKGELEKALAPVVEAANKPAVETVREVERIVVQQDANASHSAVAADGVVVVPAIPHPVKTGKKVAFNKLFGTKVADGFGQREITLWNSHGLAPAVDPFYVVNAQTMAAIATAAETNGEYVWQVGPSGSGKSTQPEQFAAYTGRRFFRFTCTKHTEVGELIGGDAAKAGDTFWVDGGLIAAMQVPGAVILIDEPTLTSPGVQAIFQAVTDDSRTYTIHSTGKVVRIADGVIFVVADNTNGCGDETGQYHGTHQSNAALVNRFRRMVRVEYMSKRQESEALVNRTNIAKPAADHVVDFFARARKLPEMEGVVMSLRQMVGFVNSFKDGFGSAAAFEMSVLNKLPNTERAAVEALATLDWHASFEAMIYGTATPQTNAPSDSSAARAFDDGTL